MRNFEVDFYFYPRMNSFKGKVAILIDGASGSTSEILAQGLQDIGRARVFGTRSAGCALPSSMVYLPNGDLFQYAFADYISVGGARLEGQGVTPDQEVPRVKEDIINRYDSH